MTKKESRIPDKGREYVIQHALHISPVCEHDGQVYFGSTDADHFTQSFPWNFERTIPATGLKEIGRIRTLHTYGYYGFFKPSLAEVINQIPEDIIDQVQFVFVNGPKDADDLNREYELVNEGYHVAETVLYAYTAREAVGEFHQ